MGLGGPLEGANLVHSLFRTGLAAFVPASVAVGISKTGLPDWVKTSAVIGAGLLTHRITGKSMKEISRGLYSQAEELSKDVVLPTENLISRIDKLQGKMSEGLKTGPKSRINDAINEIRGKAQGGAVPVKDLMQFRRDVNEISKEFTKDQLKGSENY